MLNRKWTLLRLLGSGGMGHVYEARHRNGARAAVKILHARLARNADVRERFLREGYAANRVAHPGAVRVLDDDVVRGGEHDGAAYLVMELLDGESLEERARRTPRPGEIEILDVVDAVLDVLAAAHAHGVVHRDLKPENIFLARQRDREQVRVKLLDFGLARLEEGVGATNAGIAVGTPSFMAPEQAAGRGDEVDGRTDLFSLGATMFRVLTGRNIHEAEHMIQLVVKMATQPAPPLRACALSASEAFARVVDRALAFNREDRYEDAAAMRRDVLAAREAIARSERPALAVGSAMNVDVPAEETIEEDDDADGLPAPLRTVLVPWLLVVAAVAVVGWRYGAEIREELGRGSEAVSARLTGLAAAASGAVAAPEPREEARGLATLDAGAPAARPLPPPHAASGTRPAGAHAAPHPAAAAAPPRRPPAGRPFAAPHERHR